MTVTKLFIVGSVIGKGENESWNTLGVFDDEKLAVKNCPKGCFVMPIPLNALLPERANEAEYVWWPNEQTKLDALARISSAR